MGTFMLCCKYRLRLVLVFTFCYLGSASGANAVSNDLELLAKKQSVTIATIGPRPIAVGSNMKAQQIVDRMISHWNGRFGQVLPDKPDLIVVPEACDRPAGLSADKLREYYHVRGDQVRNYFAKVAKENKCYIVYSAARETADGSLRNSSVMLDRKGDVVVVYDKNYPTTGEIDKGFVPGSDIAIAECDFGRVGFAICFDLNFDELRRRYAKAKPDLIVFTSMYHGGLMQGYWAYSCRCHFVGAIAGLPCEIRNPLGEVIASNTNYFDFAVTTVNLDSCLAHLDFNWGKLKALKAKYGPKVIITDPGYLGSVLISSENKDIGVNQMITEFDIEELDDYFERASDYRKKHLNLN